MQKSRTRSKIMAIADRHGRPVAIHIDSATPHEVTLVEATLAHRLVRKTPEGRRAVTASVNAVRRERGSDSRSVASDAIPVRHHGCGLGGHRDSSGHKVCVHSVLSW
jgi:hypothetical protein